MKYESKRNGQLFELIGEVDPKYNTALLRNVETGQEQHVTSSTLKRWYKRVEEEVPTTEPAESTEDAALETQLLKRAQEIVDRPSMTSVPMCIVPDEQPAATGVDTKKKERTRKKKEMEPDVLALHKYVLQTCEEIGGTVWVPAKDIKFRGLKVGGSNFVKYNWTNRSVILQVRSKALGLDSPKTPVNHTYDDRYTFTEYTEQSRKEIRRIMELCYAWQLERNKAKQK